MILLSKHFHKLWRCRRHFVFRCEFSEAPPIDDKARKDGEKGALQWRKRVANNNLETDNGSINVCIIGGGVTPLYTAILLKQYQIIKSINLVDTKDLLSIGSATDTFCMETSPRINYIRKKDLKRALKNVNIVALMNESDIVADNDNIVPRLQFQSAVDYVRQMTDQILRFCPDALVAVFAHPVTATVAMISEIFRCSGWWNPDKIIGSTAAYRAQIEEITATLLNLEFASLSVPITGGADARTIVPLLSRTIPFNQFTNAQRKSLLQSFRGDCDKENATTSLFEYRSSLSSGTAAAKLIIALAGGLCGFDNIITCAYVRSNVLPVCRYFTNELELGPSGVKRNLGLPKISPADILLVEQAIPLINEYIDMAVAVVQSERMRIKTQ